MKRRIFSSRLYFEGLRQTKLIGIISFVIFTIQTLAIPIGKVVEYFTFNYATVAEGIGFTEINPMLYTMIYIVAPLFPLSLFSFLNKRKASDFYHSVSDTRLCLFISFFAAICTWIIALCTLTTLIGLITNSLFPQLFTINHLNVWLTAFNILAASLYSASAVTLAMTLTGTLVTNIAVAGLILIFPDYLLYMFNTMVLSNLPFIPRNSGSGKFLPVGFRGMSYNGDHSFTSIEGAVITLILAVLLAALAMIIFKLRKSESAGSPALNKYLQAGIRISFCMFICIFACGGIFTLTKGIEYVTGTDIFVLVMIYITALLVYFLYEIITTKRFKSIVKTLPTLLIVVALNVICVISMHALYNSYLSFEPSASEIDYVTVDQSEEHVYDLSTYLEMKCSKIKLRDKNIKEITSALLSENIKKIRNDTFYDNYTSRINLTICVNGIRHQRYLTLSEEDLNTIIKSLENSQKYKESFCSLPEAASVSVNYYNNQSKPVSNEDAMRMYDIARKEIAETDFDEWYKLAYDAGEHTSIAEFYVTLTEGTKTYAFDLPIYPQFYKTANEYIKKTYDKETNNKIFEMLKYPKELEMLSIVFFNTNEISDIYYYYDEEHFDFDSLDKVTQCLVPCESIEKDDIFVRVSVYDEYSMKYDNKAKYYDYDVTEYSAIFKFTGDPEDLD